MELTDADPALQAAWLLAVDPQGLGGLCLRGPAGPARDAVLANLRQALPPEAPWRRLPLQIDDERLLGGLDLGLSLAAGRPVAQAGLLAEADGGVLLLAMAERVDAGLAAKLASALERQGGPRFCVVALDEGQSADEQMPASLLERLALIASPARPDLSAALGDLAAMQVLPFDLAAARRRLPDIPYDEATVQALCGTAAALGLVSLRPPWQAWRAACAAAAVAGRDEVTQADAELAARLVLAPRARALPQPHAEPEAESHSTPQPESSEPPQASPAEPQPSAADASPPDPSDGEQQAQALQEQLIAATQAAIPAGLLASLAGAPSRSAAGAAGRRGAAARPAQSGRPLAPRRGSLRAGSRLDLLATMRAAIPWQRLRLMEREQRGLGVSPARLLLRRDDFHIKRYRRPNETTTVFVVDASGSQALNRLAEAKGAVELLLADCYVRRDRVALIAFRGEGAEVLLAPTRSLVRARRSLSGLPGGGGTPLAAGIEAAWLLGSKLQSLEGGRALLVFLTDARANIARDGSPGRAQAMQDALSAAQRLRASGLASVLIDTSPRPQPAAMALAQAMAARYVPLPQGQAKDVHAAVTAGR
ncbi:magnesium chelatase subunit D [Paucibacter sp. PLA-PC-4]|uniref:magnesium chelatase subunit D n=1 Tax=Paucibacter sp. PLA-PC-4 TaxID=2993655 RepID=UPI00224A6D1A|nr:magnesium chelatase subunit D [Paucibacter sp. PLA-PC-4]MCX2864553.1 magnesium chelatase subunit D [Paucibacter sp. PLA-PC-4]